MPDQTRTRRVAALAKAARAAVLLPTLFALLTLLLHNPQAAGFSVFGTFAHLVMTNYAEAQRQRILQSLTVTLAGAAMIAWGTAVSTHLLLAVLSASIVAFATRAAAQSIGLLASIHTVVLLAFMLAVTAPAPLEHILPRLAGWLLSGVISLPILLITWISLNTQSPPDPQPHLNSTTHTNLVSLAGPTRAAVAMAIAVLIAGLFHLEHGFWLVLGILPVLRSADTVPRTFLQEQAGTLTGFALSALLVFLVGAQHTIYWMALPPAAFIAAYLASVGIFLAGQAAFTFFVVVLPQHPRPHRIQRRSPTLDRYSFRRSHQPTDRYALLHPTNACLLNENGF
jgi:hypothetical protein